MAQQKKINRRQFLGHVGAVGGATVLAACAPPTTTAPAAVEAPASQTLKTLRYATSQSVASTDTLDPAFRVSGPDSTLQRTAYEQLVERDQSLSPFPLLAESWEANDDGTEWTFNLREGVTFSDGKPFVAADVVYTYQRLIDPDVGSTGAGNLANVDPDGIVAVDDRTVRIKLMAPDVEFPGTTVFSQSAIVPEGATNDDLATQTLGTGPFKTDSFIPGETTNVFVKNENYWQPGKPGADVLELTSLPDAEARVAALKAGEIDIAFRVPSETWEGLEADPNILLVEQLVGGGWAGVMMIDQPPFDDNNVRLAVKYALNRQEFLDVVGGGRGSIGNDVHVNPNVEGYAPLVREFSLEKSREHLSMAGYPDGIDLPAFAISSDPEFAIWAELFQRQCAEAGIRFELGVHPGDTYWDNQWLNPEFPFMLSGWGARALSAAFTQWYNCDATWNETNWCREDSEALFAQARATVDKDERLAIYGQMQEMIFNEGGHIVPHFENGVAATRSNISGFYPHLFEVFRDIVVG